MPWRTLLFVASPVMAVAQTAVPDGTWCMRAPAAGKVLSVPLELTPRAPLGSIGQGGPAGCAVRTPPPGEAASGEVSQNPRRDALHGLPPPDLARVLPAETTE